MIDFSTPEPVVVRVGKGDISQFDIREDSSKEG